jgi:hypothetical protein
VRKSIVLLATLLIASPLLAASDFYDNLYLQGIASYDSGSYDAAIAKLRVAAFGLLDDVARFETAEAYIVSAAQHLNREEDARAALQRILLAERVERRYSKLQLPPAVRGDADRAAQALLTPAQLETLKR